MSVTANEETYNISSLSIQDGYDIRHPEFQSLTSQIEILFHGFGGGAERESTVSGMFAKQIHLTNSLQMFFYAVHDKNSSVKTLRKHPAKHKMPPSCVTLFILFRRICILLGCGSSSTIVPTIPGRTILMKHAICQHFGMDHKQVSLFDIRQMYTSITNEIYNKFPSEKIADDAGAELNNHSAAVHAMHYPTAIIGSEDKRYDMYHQALGESNHPSDCHYQLSLQPASETQILRALQSLFGQLAQFTSDEQLDMVRYSFNSRSRHKFYGLTCGGGKSLSIILPLAYEKTTMQYGGCRIFVLPYVFLNESLREAFASKLHDFDVTILAYTASSITDSTLPDTLNHHDPPDILILTADAASNLIQYHSVLLHTWQSSNLLRGIWLDEVQTYIGEFNFRQCFQKLPLYATIGAPISLLSGSYPIQMINSLLNKFSLGDTTTVDMVQSPDLIGNQLDFEVIKVPDELDMIDITINMVDKYCQRTRKAAHIMIQSKGDCIEFENRLADRSEVRVVHSDTTKDNQAEAASAWYQGKANQLYTTSLGIVGNENENLGGVFIVHTLFNLSNLLQIFGRLRPRHRGQHTKVVQLITSKDLQLSNQMKARAEDARSDLLSDKWISNEDMSSYDQAFHSAGYITLLTTNQCYFSQLSEIFTNNIREACNNHCTVCRNQSNFIQYTPPPTEPVIVSPEKTTNPYKRKAPNNSHIQQSASIARKNRMVSVNYQQQAEQKLEWLKQYCPVQSCIAGCNGELCLNGACYICGSADHKTNGCNFRANLDVTKRLDEFLAAKGICAWCLGKMKGDTDMHGPLGGESTFLIRCPMNKRLRRAINIHFQTKCRNKMTYGPFLRSICASDETYYKFISELDIDISAPRRTIN